ncbi:hypothetical protein HXX76_008803 [Chlamydomonas incerta]|uniref:Uncharacterized protein n=1 Tax=Chlamydomonas incerta TaxID=51695 RepID=A0A835SSQ8_CHLIN|nr:hypothetical protein HXX76_008803 [Chlamydomonas incerta]|eukprot:KAG2432458.1 hypothetical protein HXX76_008803 [Chlamydomonas incerta]
MRALCCVVEASSLAKSTKALAAGSLHCVDDAAQLVAFCEGLPQAFSVVESVPSADEDTVADCVQGVSGSLQQLQTSLIALGAYQGEGILGVLMEHPAAWLDLYRGFRALTAQLGGLSTLVRSCGSHRRQADAVEVAHSALEASLKSFMAICARSKDAANLLGSDLPDFARAAAEAGWDSERLASALAAQSSPATCSACSSSCDTSGSGGSAAYGALSASSSGSAAAAAAAALSTAASAAEGADASAHGAAEQSGLAWGLRKLMGRSSPRSSAGSSPSCSPRCAASPCGSASVGRAALGAAACSLVSRIQESILYDSEMDQLEQDRAYLMHRIQCMRDFLASITSTSAASAPSSSPSSSSAAAAASSRGAEQVAAAASLMQSEVLLAAVDARVAVMRELEESQTCTASTYFRSAAAKAVAYAACASAVATAPGAAANRCDTPKLSPAGSLGLSEAEDLGQMLPKRRSLRWLPTCFVGA